MNRPLLSDSYYYIVLEDYRLDVSIGIHDFERAKTITRTASPK